jgi:hypothetical protein
MKQATPFKTSVLILLIFTLNTFAQQSYEYSKDVLQDFCSISILKNEHVEDYSNISDWVNKNLESLFFGFGPYNLSSRNESGFMSLSTYDDGKGLQIPIYDDKIVFEPTASPKKRANRNRYQLKTECVLPMLSYCTENFISAFDYRYNSYFEMGANRLNLNIKEILAHTLNTCVASDYSKGESVVEIFLNEVNKHDGIEVKMTNNDKNNEFKNLLAALQSQYNEKQILFLIYKTFIEKDTSYKTEESLNNFYKRFTNERFIPFIDKELNYNLKIAFENSGYLNISNDILELVNKDTKEIISDGSNHVKIPIFKVVDFNFAIDNVPRLTIKFDIDTRNKKMYKVNTGFSRTVLKKYEHISKDNPKYLEIAHVKVVYYNDRIQIWVSTADDDYNNYASYRIVNEKRKQLLPNE